MSFSNAATGQKPADPYKKANEEEVDVKTKITDFGQFIEKCKFSMLTTKQSGSSRLVSRAMALAATVRRFSHIFLDQPLTSTPQENEGIDLLFHTNTESGKTDDVASNPEINVSFQNASGEWASVSGSASIVTDRDLVEKHYSPVLKAWLGDLGDGVHDGSASDPRIGIIRVRTETVTYALATKGLIRQAVEITQSAIQGKPAQVNSLREISEEEVKAWRAVH